MADLRAYKSTRYPMIFYPIKVRTIYVPHSEATAIRGRPGMRTIKELEAKSGALVRLCRVPEPRSCPIHPGFYVNLDGSPEKVEKAEELLLKLLGWESFSDGKAPICGIDGKASRMGKPQYAALMGK